MVPNLNLTNEQIFALAAIDVFVEKAQRVLTRRSRTLYIARIFSTFFIFVILGIAVFFIHSLLGKPIPAEITGYFDPQSLSPIPLDV